MSSARWLFAVLACFALVALLVSPTRPLRADSSTIILPHNGTARLQMSNKQPIRKVVNPRENTVVLRSVAGDPTTVLVIGEQPDVTRIELTDFNGHTETYEVIVQADGENLRTKIHRAVPSANVVPIPTSNKTVILAGTVASARDIVPIVSAVKGAGFDVVNALRIGGVQEVQLDVVVAQLRPGLARTVVHSFLNRTGGPTATEPTPNACPTNVRFGLIDNRSSFLVVLNALRAENLVKVLAEPRLVTLTGRPASFLAGGEQAVPVSDSSGQVGVQFEEFGTRLNFLPTVLGNGKINLEVEPEVSCLDPARPTKINGIVLPGRTTHRVNTTVELKAGQTFAIGGLVRKQVQATELKVPVLGDLPVVGPAFTTRTFCNEEVEMIVLVTPSLVPAPGDQTTEACSQEPPSASKPNLQENEGSPRKDAAERLRRLERRLQRIQEEIGDLQQEVHSLRASDPVSSRKP